jgi:3-deoxy-D-manno-octulosonate 8-phosphate phosphatase (KDO 8-P phosphatase)
VTPLTDIRLVVFDFDGVFTDNTVTVSETGVESVVCCRSDGLGLHRLRAVGVPAMVLSTETNQVVRVRAEKLGLPCIHGCEDKLSALRNEAEQRGLDLAQIAFVGNDINDGTCLQNVGVAVVVADAYAEVMPFADIVLKRRGGDGAVREFCDLVWCGRTDTEETSDRA